VAASLGSGDGSIVGSQRRNGLALMAAALVLVAAGAVAVLSEDAGLVWVDRLLRHPFIFGAVAAPLFGLGLKRRFRRRRWVAVPLLVVGVIVGVVWALLGLLATWLVGTTTVARVAAPVGGYHVVVREGVDAIDPFWDVVIQQDGGPFARQWAVGCINGDWNAFRGVSWDATGRLVVKTSGGPAPVVIDPDTVRPQRLTHRQWGC
jgi:hypothetical protein